MPRNLKRRLQTLMIGAVMLMLSVPAAAELYQYTDENGITRLTNNKYSVPAKDRHRLEPFSDFTPLSSEITIRTLPETLPPPPAAEKVILPKTFKLPMAAAERVVLPPLEETIPADDAPPPALASESAPLPAQTFDAETSKDTPVMGQVMAEPHKSSQIIIEKQVPPVLKGETDIAVAEKQAIPESASPSPKAPPAILETPKPSPPAPDPIPAAIARKKPPVPSKSAAAIPDKSPDAMDSASEKIETPKMPPAETLKPDFGVAQHQPSPAPAPMEAPPAPVEISTPYRDYAALDSQALPADPPVLAEPPAPETISKGPTGTSGIQPSEDPAESSRIDTARDETSLDLALLESTQKKLMEKKKTLNLKFQLLMKEKQDIENELNEDDEASVLTYNEKVKKLNIRIKEYNMEKKILQAQIEKYNSKIEDLSANASAGEKL